MKAEVLKEFHERIVKSFMDKLILAELKKGRPMSGYDVMEFIYKKFGLLISSGTVYNILYSLERNELIKGMRNRKKRVYKLTDKGEETINIILNSYGKIENLGATLYK